MEKMHRVTFRPKGSTSTWWDVAHDGLTAEGAATLLAKRSASNPGLEYRIERLNPTGWAAA